MVLQAAPSAEPPRIVAATELDAKTKEVVIVPSAPPVEPASASNQSATSPSSAPLLQEAKVSETATAATAPAATASLSAELPPSSNRPPSVGYYSPQPQANTLRSIPSLPSLAPDRIQKPSASTIPIPAAAHLVSSPAPPPMHNIYVPPSAAVGIPAGTVILFI